ncbi:MAG: hypothetical protein JXR58_09830 [Bacteroidales bacterium]|nr:hypothetical protein [Bacteroidales bacterium]
MKQFVFGLLLFSVILPLQFFAQVKNQEKKESSEIEILNAEYLEYVEVHGNFQKLVGNVVFKHDNALLYCDTAHFYKDNNSLIAFSNVYIRQGDSLHMYGNWLKYDGKTKIAKFRKKVKLVDKELTLFTDSLDFDRNTNIGKYEHGASIIDNENDLASKVGYYYSDKKLMFFKDSVVLINPQYTMYSDTLKYHTGTEIAYFYGPTRIVSDSNLIYCENGWYDTKKDISRFSKNAFLQSPTQKLSGDSLYYDRKLGFGEGLKNVEIIDTTEKLILRGNIGHYFQSPERSMMTDSAVFINYSEGDSLYLHADTLRMHTFNDTIKQKRFINVADSLRLSDSLLVNAELLTDSLGRKRTSREIRVWYPIGLPTDTVVAVYVDTAMDFKMVRGFYRVKMYKSDFQGKCDSLVYSTMDSTMKLYHDPILWSDNNQLTAEFIEMLTGNNTIKEVMMRNKAMIIADQDSIRFNQIKGREMKGFFNKSDLRRIDVSQNSQVIYFIEDDSGDTTDLEEKEFIGVNYVESSKMIIHLEDGEVSRIHFIPASDGRVMPLDEKPASEQRLEGFAWRIEHRPKKLADIFLWEGFSISDKLVIKFETKEEDIEQIDKDETEILEEEIF